MNDKAVCIKCFHCIWPSWHTVTPCWTSDSQLDVICHFEFAGITTTIIYLLFVVEMLQVKRKYQYQIRNWCLLQRQWPNWMPVLPMDRLKAHLDDEYERWKMFHTHQSDISLWGQWGPVWTAEQDNKRSGFLKNVHILLQWPFFGS